MQDDKEYITIPLKEYHELLKDSEFLNALREFGVDNWGGYGEAMNSLEDCE